ncbi:MAG TPA: universal stress protein [Chloroflexia bacterium]|nr:universal stress protein [Chloroflexia bacterium]
MSTMLGTGLRLAADTTGTSTLPRPEPTTVLVPMLNTGAAQEMLELAALCAAGYRAPDSEARAKPHIVVLSVVEVPAGQPLTMGLDMARSYRALLDFLPAEVEAAGRRVRVDRLVKVARDVPSAVQQAVRDENAGMVLFYWKGYARDPKRYVFGATLDGILKKPPCDVVIARPEKWRESQRVLLPVRGGPSAEHALDLALILAEDARLPITVLHNITTPTGGLRDTEQGTLGDEPYAMFAHYLEEAKASAQVQVSSVVRLGGDPASALLNEARPDDFMIMGMAPLQTPDQAADRQGNFLTDTLPVPLHVASEKGPPFLLIRRAGVIDLADYTREARSHRGRKGDGDMPSERWFVENTYHGDEFKEPEEFLKLKQASGLSLSVALLTFNDAERLYSIITGLKRVLSEMHPIADQIAVIDAGSSDGSADVARSLGVEVYEAEDILPGQGALYGRGESWWKSLAVLKGDVLVWLDPGARKFHPSSAMSLAGPLLRSSSLMLVKAFGQAGGVQGKRGAEAADEPEHEGIEWGGSTMPRREGGTTGRVKVQGLTLRDLLTLDAQALTALPPNTLLQALFPAVGGVIAPFGRDMAARRDAMLKMPALTGDNLEVGLLLSVASEFGARSVAQVELRHSVPQAGPQPGTRNTIEVLQVLGMRLRDPRMKQVALDLIAKLENGNGGRYVHSAASGPAVVEVRALAPVERPAMEIAESKQE